MEKEETPDWSHCLFDCVTEETPGEGIREVAVAWLIKHAKTHEEKALLALAQSDCIQRTDMVRALLACGADAKAVDGDKQNALMWAVNSHLADCVELLIPCSNLEQRSSLGKTALFIAASRHAVGCVEALLPHCHSLVNDQGDRNGNTALMIACAKGDERIVDLLLPVSDWSLKNHNGETALMVASKKNRVDIVKNLLDAGCDATAVGDYSRQNALMVAALHDGAECAQLLSAHVDLSAVDARGENALMLAARSGSLKTVKAFSALLDPKAANLIGGTPLMLAAESGKIGGLDCVKHLLPLSDLNAVNADGRDALRVAVTARNWAEADEIAKLMPIQRVILAQASAPPKSMPMSEARIEGWALAEAIKASGVVAPNGAAEACAAQDRPRRARSL